jgi:hypothetical protein
VPGRAPGSSRPRVDDDGGLQYVLRKIDRALSFSRQGEYIGERAVSEGGPGGLTPWWRGPGLGHATLGCGRPVAPLCLIFGLREAWVKIGGFGFCFVQFREYFLCSFSETQKQQKTGNW